MSTLGKSDSPSSPGTFDVRESVSSLAASGSGVWGLPGAELMCWTPALWLWLSGAQEMGLELPRVGVWGEDLSSQEDL